MKFNYSHGNGIQDASELGLPNRTIQIQYPNGTVAETATTNAMGIYCVKLPAGDSNRY